MSGPAKDEKPKGEAPAGKGKKFLIIGLASAVVVIVALVAALFFVMKGSKDAEESEGDGGHEAAQAHKDEAKVPPVYMEIESFVVNLSDVDRQTYAQLQIVLVLSEPSSEEKLKPFLPAFRSEVLSLVSSYSFAQLGTQGGKLSLLGGIKDIANKYLPSEKKNAPEEVKEVLFKSIIFQ